MESETAVELLHAWKAFSLLQERRNLRRDRAWDAFLEHVQCSVPLYRGSIWIPDRQVLAGIPLSERQDLIRYPHLFTSRRFVANVDTLILKTSGTCGTPLTIQFDPASWFDCNYGTLEVLLTTLLPSDAIQSQRLICALITNKPGRQPQTFYLPNLAFSLLSRFVIGRDPDSDTATVKALRQASIPVLYGKGFYLRHLADLDETLPSSGHWIRPTVIVASGEPLYADDRLRLSRWFACPVINAYTSTEGGLIAMEETGQTGMRILDDRVRIEVLDGSGCLTPEGAGELVLTNLTNWMTAVVRYRTGDFGTVQRQFNDEESRPIVCISDFPGREPWQFITSRRVVHVWEIENALLGLNVWDFQVIQLAHDELRVKWALPHTHTREIPLEQHLWRIFRALFPSERLILERVSSLTPLGGKRRRYWPLVLDTRPHHRTLSRPVKDRTLAINRTTP
jgi:phenylacetate-coenzyme A ligase PaaK-like adenylate-forming protein